MKSILAPSILSADFSKLKSEIQEIEAMGATWFHVDVMDGHFVPNMTLGPIIVQSIRPQTQSVLDCHLMVEKPEAMVPWFIKAGADVITFHVEASQSPVDLIKAIKKSGIKAGISIKPNTPVETIESLLPELDLVLVMSVEPGFGGQSFMPASLHKVKWLKEQKTKNSYSFLIEIDGGINETTALAARAAGVEVFVAGNALFSAPDRKKAYENLMRAIS